MKHSNVIVAIDGYSSCGKSTLAKKLAIALNYMYIDTGAMYRAATLHFIKNDVEPFDQIAVAECLKTAQIDFTHDMEFSRIWLNGANVSDEIRNTAVANKVSQYSAIPCVRRALISQQQTLGSRNNVVMDGRDIGTEVFPKALVKLFITAEARIRAQRRHNELSLTEPNLTLEEVYASLQKRDLEDTTRTISPLICATDAIQIDNSRLTIQQTLDLSLGIIGAKTQPEGRIIKTI